jgi:hypothetical protein
METAFIWYLVVTGPQRGLAALPSPFDSRANCIVATEEFKKANPPPGWDTQCVPGGPPYDAEQPVDENILQQ